MPGTEQKSKKRLFLRTAPIGLAVGFLAGLFGAGGGMIAVPALRWLGLDEEHAHATSISVMLPLSILSGFLYLRSDSFRLQEALVYWPGGIIGAVVGALLLPRLKAKWIRRIFALVILGCAVRLLLR